MSAEVLPSRLIDNILTKMASSSNAPHIKTKKPKKRKRESSTGMSSKKTKLDQVAQSPPRVSSEIGTTTQNILPKKAPTAMPEIVTDAKPLVNLNNDAKSSKDPQKVLLDPSPKSPPNIGPCRMCANNWSMLGSYKIYGKLGEDGSKGHCAFSEFLAGLYPGPRDAIHSMRLDSMDMHDYLGTLQILLRQATPFTLNMLTYSNESATTLCELILSSYSWHIATPAALGRVALHLLEEMSNSLGEGPASLVDKKRIFLFVDKSKFYIPTGPSFEETNDLLITHYNSHSTAYSLSISNLRWAIKTSICGPYQIFPSNNVDLEKLCFFWLISALFDQRKKQTGVPSNYLSLAFIYSSQDCNVSILWCFATAGLSDHCIKLHVDSIYFLLPRNVKAMQYAEFHMQLVRARYFARGANNVLSAQDCLEHAIQMSGGAIFQNKCVQALQDQCKTFLQDCEKLREDPEEKHVRIHAIGSKASLPYFFVEDVVEDVFQQLFLQGETEHGKGLPPIILSWALGAPKDLRLPSNLWWLPTSLHRLFYDHNFAYIEKLIKTLDFIVNLTLYGKSPGKLNEYMLRLKRNMHANAFTSLCHFFSVEKLFGDEDEIEQSPRAFGELEQSETKTHPETPYRYYDNILPILPIPNANCDLSLLLNQYMNHGLHETFAIGQGPTLSLLPENKLLTYCTFLEMGLRMYGLTECIARDELYPLRTKSDQATFKDIPLGVEFNDVRPQRIPFTITNQCIYCKVNTCRKKERGRFDLKEDWVMYDGTSQDCKPIPMGKVEGKDAKQERTLLAFKPQEGHFRHNGFTLQSPVLRSLHNIHPMLDIPQEYRKRILVALEHEEDDAIPQFKESEGFKNTKGIATHQLCSWINETSAKHTGEALKLAVLIMFSLGTLYMSGDKAPRRERKEAKWKSTIEDVLVGGLLISKNTDVTQTLVQVSCFSNKVENVPTFWTFLLAKLFWSNPCSGQFANIIPIISRFFEMTLDFEELGLMDSVFQGQSTAPLKGLLKIFPNVPRSLRELIFTAKYNWTGFQIIDDIGRSKVYSIFVYGKQAIERTLTRRETPQNLLVKTNIYVLSFEYDPDRYHVENLKLCIPQCLGTLIEGTTDNASEPIVKHVSLYTMPITEYIYDRLLNNALFILCKAPGE